MLESSQEEFNSVDWSPDGNRLVTGSPSSVSIVDITSGLVTLKFAEEVHWNPDGQRIAASIRGESVRLGCKKRDASPKRQRQRRGRVNQYQKTSFAHK